MVTRRTAIGAGLAFASMACTAGFGASGSASRRRPVVRSIDALLIDETIELPSALAAFLDASRRALAVVGIQLDAAGYAGLMRVLHKGHTLVGISCGATLFCVERIAWDHGFRLTRRSERCVSDPGDDAWRQDVAGFLSSALPPAASPSPLARAYRPSRADGTLHAWVMQKSASPQFRQGRREVWP